MKRLVSLAAVLFSITLVFSPATAQSLGNTLSYDLLFRNGTLDSIPRNATLTYQRTVKNQLQPAMAKRDNGKIVLRFVDDKDNSGQQSLVRLRFYQGTKYRTIGHFPASVGNPLIMYFIETILRNVAQSVGSSPFYIRNRIKEALARPAEVATIPITIAGKSATAKVVTLYPFIKDPNAKRMQGFADLQLKATMSESVPGWYQSLQATVPGPEDTPLYSATISFKQMDLQENVSQ